MTTTPPSTRTDALPVDTDCEYRCSRCNKLFFKGALATGSCIEQKCPRCGELNRFFKI